MLGVEEERGMSSPLHLELRGQSTLCPQREEGRQPRARLSSSPESNSCAFCFPE